MDPGRGHTKVRRHARAAGARLRVWIDLTNSPHVLVMRPVIDVAARAAATMSRSPRATSRRRSGCSSASASTTRRSATTAAARWPPSRSAWRRARPRWSRWAARPADSTSRSATAPTTSGRRGAAAHPVRHRRSTTSSPASSTRSTAAWPGASWCRRRSRPSGSRRYGATPAKLRRYEGLKEEYYLADFEPEPRRARRAGPRPRAAARGRAHAARGVALPPLRGAASSPRCWSACGASRSSCCRARPSSAPSWPGAAGSPCPSGRSTPSR